MKFLNRLPLKLTISFYRFRTLNSWSRLRVLISVVFFFIWINLVKPIQWSSKWYTKFWSPNYGIPLFVTEWLRNRVNNHGFPVLLTHCMYTFFFHGNVNQNREQYKPILPLKDSIYGVCYIWELSEAVWIFKVQQNQSNQPEQRTV